MLTKKSAGAVIFRKEKNKIFYLILHCPSSLRSLDGNSWGFAKGHVEKGEELKETAKREIFEETGLKDVKFILGFKEILKYSFKRDNKIISKTVVLFLAETKFKEVKISNEHIGFKWLSYEEALSQLTYADDKKILKKANDYLKVD
jgi:8-oxo-dGTP pyrophosphatase MutT (NUDIX family)